MNKIKNFKENNENILKDLGITLTNFDTPLGVQWEVDIEYSKIGFLSTYISTVKYIEFVEELEEIVKSLKILTR